ncbi:hypothetical protein Trydic_g967 [Trypoxylus dichotomus]
MHQLAHDTRWMHLSNSILQGGVRICTDVHPSCPYPSTPHILPRYSYIRTNELSVLAQWSLSCRKPDKHIYGSVGSNPSASRNCVNTCNVSSESGTYGFTVCLIAAVCSNLPYAGPTPYTVT